MFLHNVFLWKNLEMKPAPPKPSYSQENPPHPPETGYPKVEGLRRKLQVLTDPAP